MECDKADPLFVFADDFFVEPLECTAGGRIVGKVVHLEEIVERFNDDEPDVTIFGQNFVEFEKMVVARRWLSPEDGWRMTIGSSCLMPLFVKSSAASSVVLGVLAFVVPIPHREDHGVKIGDTKIGVQTESSEKLPPAVGIVLMAGGVLALVVGLRKT